MRTSVRSRLAAATATAAVTLGIAVAPAAAAPPDQTGLINVNASDNTIQVPVSVAANICGIQVGALAVGLAQGEVDCTATSESEAVSVARPDNGPGGSQTGLVNVNLSDNVIQIPVSVAANVCGIQAGVLAAALVQGPVTCDARSRGRADAS
jgi:hypothetical protein